MLNLIYFPLVSELNRDKLYCTREQWAEKYGSGARYWEQDTAHPLFYSSMQKVGVKPGATVFFPMCGKTVEMKQLYDQGYNVVGKKYIFLSFWLFCF